MSYASVTSHNKLPPSMQPHADPALLNTGRSPASGVLEDTGPKVNVVDSSYKDHPATTTSVNRPLPDSEYEIEEGRGSHRKKAKRDFEHAEHKGTQLWERLQEQLIRPGVAGGLLGVVNVGLLGTLSYQLYTQPDLRTDTKFLGWSGAGALVVLGAEGFLAEAYRNTAQGREEERRAREEGAALYKHTKEIVLRPNVFSGLLGVVNLGIIGGVSYVAYDNWDRPQWDRRTVSAVTIGLLSLVAGEGFLAEQYREKEYPKRR